MGSHLKTEALSKIISCSSLHLNTFEKEVRSEVAHLKVSFASVFDHILGFIT